MFRAPLSSSQAGRAALMEGSWDAYWLFTGSNNQTLCPPGWILCSRLSSEILYPLDRFRFKLHMSTLTEWLVRKSYLGFQKCILEGMCNSWNPDSRDHVIYFFTHIFYTRLLDPESSHSDQQQQSLYLFLFS